MAKFHETAAIGASLTAGRRKGGYENNIREKVQGLRRCVLAGLRWIFAEYKNIPLRIQPMKTENKIPALSVFEGPEVSQMTRGGWRHYLYIRRNGERTTAICKPDVARVFCELSGAAFYRAGTWEAPGTLPGKMPSIRARMPTISNDELTHRR